MSAAFWLSMVMATAGCAGLILAGRGKWQGWAIGLAVQPVWLAFGIITEGYGLIISAFMYGFVYAKNLLKWRAEARRGRVHDLEALDRPGRDGARPARNASAIALMVKWQEAWKFCGLHRPPTTPEEPT